MKLLVQEFLESHTFKELEDQYGVFATPSKCKTFCTLNYGMIEAKDSDKLSQQCRGTIISKTDGSVIDETIPLGETTILSLGFYRFFNEGQGAAANIDWNDPDLKIYNKEDGTCIFVWYNPFTNKWNVSTRGSPEANVPLDSNKNMTFRSLFEQTLSKNYDTTFDDFTSRLDPNNTYIFELCTFYNRIVVNYSESKIFFIGARNLRTLKEFNIENPIFDIQVPNIPRPIVYSFMNASDIANYVSSKNATEHEGVVVLDSNFNRVKIKNPMHGLASRARDSLGTSDRNCMECILLGKDDDLIPLLPQEIVDNLLSIKSKYATWIRSQEDLYARVYAETQEVIERMSDKGGGLILPTDNSYEKKMFAITLNKYPEAYRAAFFNVFAGKANSVKDFIDKSKKEGTWTNSTLDSILERLPITPS